MSEDMWAGRCRDCFSNKNPLLGLSESGLANPFVAGFALCKTCYDARMEDYRNGKASRPIGIPPDVAAAEWIDLENIQVEFPNDPALKVKVRVRLPKVPNPTGADGGEVRIQIGENPWWEPTEVLDFETLGCDPNRLKSLAYMGAQLALHYRFQTAGGRVVGLS